MTDQIVQDMIDRLGYTETAGLQSSLSGQDLPSSPRRTRISRISAMKSQQPGELPDRSEGTFSYLRIVQSPVGTISNYSQQTMLSYYQKSNKNYSINFASEDDARAAIEQYKMDLMQDGDVVVDGSETLTFTVQPQAALTVMDQSTGEVKALVGGRGEPRRPTRR